MKGDFVFDYIRPPDSHHTFRSTLLHSDYEMIVLEHEAHVSKPLGVIGEGLLPRAYRVIWFLFKGEPYDIGKFYRLDGTWIGYYVDILEPVQWDGVDAGSLRPIVDLFLDVWISPDGEYSVLDEDELDLALRDQAISSEQARQARDVLEGLVDKISKAELPPRRVKEWPSLLPP